MAKNLKLNIKNTQIAQAVNLGALKGKIGKKKTDSKVEDAAKEHEVGDKKGSSQEEKKEESPKIKARSKSAFADGNIPHLEVQPTESHLSEHQEEKHSNGHYADVSLEEQEEISTRRKDHRSGAEEGLSSTKHGIHKESTEHLSPESLRAKIFKETPEEIEEEEKNKAHKAEHHKGEPSEHKAKKATPYTPSADIPVAPAPMPRKTPSLLLRKTQYTPPLENLPVREKLGPTGKHVKDLAPPLARLKEAKLLNLNSEEENIQEVKIDRKALEEALLILKARAVLTVSVEAREDIKEAPRLLQFPQHQQMLNEQKQRLRQDPGLQLMRKKMQSQQASLKNLEI